MRYAYYSDYNLREDYSSHFIIIWYLSNRYMEVSSLNITWSPLCWVSCLGSGRVINS